MSGQSGERLAMLLLGALAAAGCRRLPGAATEPDGAAPIATASATAAPSVVPRAAPVVTTEPPLPPRGAPPDAEACLASSIGATVDAVEGVVKVAHGPYVGKDAGTERAYYVLALTHPRCVQGPLTAGRCMDSGEIDEHDGLLREVEIHEPRTWKATSPFDVRKAVGKRVRIGGWVQESERCPFRLWVVEDGWPNPLGARE
jgi:hypothetical protein